MTTASNTIPVQSALREGKYSTTSPSSSTSSSSSTATNTTRSGTQHNHTKTSKSVLTALHVTIPTEQQEDRQDASSTSMNKGSSSSFQSPPPSQQQQVMSPLSSATTLSPQVHFANFANFDDLHIPSIETTSTSIVNVVNRPSSSRNSSPPKSMNRNANALRTISESRASDAQTLSTSDTTALLATPKSTPKSIGIHSSSSSRKKLETSGYGASGHVQSRTSSSELLLKKWKDTYWLHAHPVQIHLFHSSQDREEWKYLDQRLQQLLQLQKEDGWNEKKKEASEIQKKCKKLVKWSIDFDTHGVVQRKVEKEELRQRQGQGQGQGQRTQWEEEAFDTLEKSKGSSKNRTSEKGIHRPIQYILEDVRSKFYKKDGPLLHSCKVSYQGMQGRTLAAAFASEMPHELKVLRHCIRTCLKLSAKKKKKKRSKNKKAAVGASSNGMTADNHATKDGLDGDSDIGGSSVSGMSSCVSAYSKTVYGPKTMTKKASVQWAKMKWEQTA